jgi:tetratricopeptide (TPR) repeat protein
MSEKTEVKIKNKKYTDAVGPGLKKLLIVIFVLFALLVVNSVYLLSVTFSGPEYQNWFYLNMFLLHLALGLLIIVPVIVFGVIHIRNTRQRKNRRAVRVGYALFTVSILLMISGIILARFDIFGFRFEVNDPTFRQIAYWMHVLTPLIAIWLFIIHRLAGPKIKWRMGLNVAVFALIFAVGMMFLHNQDPRTWNQVGPESGVKYFFPSLARTSDGNFIPARTLINDSYCKDCHTTVHEGWANSAHKFSSFNNPVYEFSVKNTRRKMMERDGNVKGSRFCAGCHDPVPFFSGAFDDPKFDDPDYDLGNDSMAQAGITCTVCHSISNINSPKGNSDFTIDEPIHYPFAFSDNKFLKWINHQLLKAKPAFHKATFLKPLHKTPEFCGTCHKVHLPKELNNYKWLRGQNHYDAFWLSGVSGQGITSFYYPPKAEESCNRCHMPLVATSDAPNFAAKVRDESGKLKTFDHMFPSANTGMPHLLPNEYTDPKGAIEAHNKFNEGVMRVDIFGVKEGGRIDGELTAPVGPNVPKLSAGSSYLFEIVIRTLKMGHLFTQGTADSNEVWMNVNVTLNGEKVGQSGSMDERGQVDPWSHFVNAFVIDREGNRIDRRNAEDIFVALYNNQIPPGAADVLHYRFDVPQDAQGELVVEATLKYRKFDTTIMELVTDDPNYINDLPIMILAKDRVVFKIGEETTEPEKEAFKEWMRWNDYGIALFRKKGSGETRQARQAFETVEKMGHPEGPLNLARVFIREGLIQTDAPNALERADKLGAYQWSLLWFGAQVAQRNGDYPKAIENIREILKGGFSQAAGRGFDFSKDYRLLNSFGSALYQSGLTKQQDERVKTMTEARDTFLQALKYDPENMTAHWGLYQVFRDLNEPEKAEKHLKLHATYKPDDNAKDVAFAKARHKYPAANRAAEGVVIYDLNSTKKENTDGK